MFLRKLDMASEECAFTGTNIIIPLVIKDAIEKKEAGPKENKMRGPWTQPSK